jgi:hypothetical protein
VSRWALQFDIVDQNIVVAEIDRALKKVYFNQSSISSFITGLVTYEAFVGEDAVSFWSNASLLNIQGVSESQRYLVSVLNEAIVEEHNVNVPINANNADYWIYIDDGLFSGDQAVGDIRRWIETSNPRDGVLNVVVIIVHTYGEFRFKKEIKPLLLNRGIRLNIWRMKNLENRLKYRDQTDLIWPTQVYSGRDIEYWQELRNNDLRNFTARGDGTVGGEELYSSVDAKKQVEEAFTRKGAEICTYGAVNHALMKPLGYSPFKTYGFGTIFATHRNCPNNAPLVLWWGDPDGNQTLRKWYPLLQRRTRPIEFDNEDF